MAVGVVVPAAGRGSRFGSERNKIWQRAAGRSLLDWTLAAFDSHPEVDQIVIAGAPTELADLREAAAPYRKAASIVEGGATRAESVENGLLALPPACDIILVHDAARPAVSHDLISRVIAAAREYGAAVPGLRITDTVKRTNPSGLVAETISRDNLWMVQTPQGARTADLRQAYDRARGRIATLTDEASVLEASGFPVAMVEGQDNNVKVTVPEDLGLVEGILGSDKGERMKDEARPVSSVIRHPSSFIRTGFGYDVHAFADGRDLWLGGVRIPHERGLAGHSDADVVLHAVCDALLGAAGMGDIGELFPDTDAAHKDRASMEFVRDVAHQLAGEDWHVSNVDIALVAEEPRVGPYRDAMRTAIAGGLGIAPTQVNIKATTSEKMGFVGRREGVACWAVATIWRPAHAEGSEFDS